MLFPLTQDDTMSRPVTTGRLPSAYTLFGRLLTLRDRLAAPRREKPDGRTRLALEPMEERIVLDGRTIPHPMIFAGSGAGHPSLVTAYDADAGVQAFQVSPYGPG